MAFSRRKVRGWSVAGRLFNRRFPIQEITVVSVTAQDESTYDWTFSHPVTGVGEIVDDGMQIFDNDLIVWRSVAGMDSQPSPTVLRLILSDPIAIGSPGNWRISATPIAAIAPGGYRIVVPQTDAVV